MRRPFFWLAGGLSAGILIGQFFSLPQIPVLLSILFLLPLIGFARGKVLFLPLFVTALIGLGLFRIQGTKRLPSNHISHWAKEGWMTLNGKVASLPEIKEKGRRKIFSLVLEADRFFQEGESFEAKGKVQVFLFNPAQMPLFGSRIRIRGKWKWPPEPLNPGGFDYRKYLATQGILGIIEGYGSRSLELPDRKVLPPSPWEGKLAGPSVAIQRLRDFCARRFNRLFQIPASALLKALILGTRKSLPEGLQDDFVKTGTAHLLAISGMNITLVAGSLFLIALCLGLPQRGSAAVGLVATIGYVFLSGAGIPVVRAGWMTGFFFVGLLLERQRDVWNGVFFSLFAILFLEPQAMFQVGFQLSFLCVFSLLLLTRGVLFEAKGDWYQTLVVSVGTFPLIITYFNIFSWTSLLANALAIPLLNLGVLGGLASLLCGTLPFFGPLCVALTKALLQAGLGWIHALSMKSWTCTYLSSPSPALMISYYSALALVWAASRLKTNRVSFLRPLSLGLWFVISAFFFRPVGSPHFALTVLAAGSSELLHVQFPNGRHWVVNSGRAEPSNQARWVLDPFLKKAGVNEIDGVLLTDFSKRHSGGFKTLQENFRVKRVLFPLKDSETDWKSGPGRGSFVRAPLTPNEFVAVSEKGGFQILDIIEGYVFPVIYHDGLTLLVLPTGKPRILRQLLSRIHKLSSVDVLIAPASGTFDTAVWQEILSSLLPAHVVFSKRNASLDPLMSWLEREDIPCYFLNETGALRFELRDGQFLVLPFLPKSLH